MVRVSVFFRLVRVTVPSKYTRKNTVTKVMESLGTDEKKQHFLKIFFQFLDYFYFEIFHES